MKIFLYIIFMFAFLLNCTVKRGQLVHYLSPGVENMKLFPANKADSLKIDTFISNTKKCIEAGGLYCGVCNPEIWADFPTGMSGFRKALFENFKPPKNTKVGESRIRVIIGAHDNIEKVEILKYTDELTKKAIEEAFKIKELHAWKSARIYGIPVKEQFETSIFVERK